MGTIAGENKWVCERKTQTGSNFVGGFGLSGVVCTIKQEYKEKSRHSVVFLPPFFVSALCCDSCLHEEATAADRRVVYLLKSTLGASAVAMSPESHVVSPEWVNLVSSFLLLSEYTDGVSFLSLFFFFSELPYGWEKIDDPIYGSYYVE